MTTAFYAPPDAVQGRRLVLPESEARHATRALRHRPGDEIAVVDGEGRRHRVRLDQVGEEKAAGVILSTERAVGEPPYHLTVGLGLIKKRSRFETFLEKAVELGAGRLVPLLTRRTEKQHLREDRARRILVAALKQSGRSRLPSLAAPTALGDVLEGLSSEEGYDHVFIAHRRDDSPGAPFARALGALAERANDTAARQLLVLVGPEGGFAEEEVRAAEDAGARVVSLGPCRLRAETAALAACTAVMLAVGGGMDEGKNG